MTSQKNFRGGDGSRTGGGEGSKSAPSHGYVPKSFRKARHKNFLKNLKLFLTFQKIIFEISIPDLS